MPRRGPNVREASSMCSVSIRRHAIHHVGRRHLPCTFTHASAKFHSPGTALITELKRSGQAVLCAVPAPWAWLE